MQLSEVFSKIANNTPLNQAEKDFFVRTGDDLQLRASEVGGWTGADGRPFFRNGLVSGGDIQVGKYIIAPVGARISSFGTTQNCINATYTLKNFTTIDYNESTSIDLTNSPTKITILSKGIYSVFLGAVFNSVNNNSGTYVLTRKNGLDFFPATTGISYGALSVLSAYDEKILNAGDYLEMVTYSAGTLEGSTKYNITGAFLAVRKIRSSD